MAAQLGVIGALFLCAMITASYCHDHRMDDRVFIGSLVGFIVIPLIVGSMRWHAHRAILLGAAGLLLLCPLAFIVTDPLAADFEKVRDGYFLGTFGSIVFVCRIWLSSSYKNGREIQVIAAGLGMAWAATAVFVLLWMVMYFE